jgi:hypothetical protein
MKIRPTGAFALIAAAAIAVAIYRKWPDERSLPAIPSARPSTLVEQPVVPRAPASAAGAREAAVPSLADLTRLTIQSLASKDAEVRKRAIDQLLPALAQRDPVAAARVADLFVDSPLRPQILSTVARAWTDHNRLHALAWAQGLGDANERENVLVEIFTQIAQSDPAAAVRLRQEYSPDPLDDAELTNLAQRWAETDISAVLGWTDSLPPGAQHDQLIARAAFIQAQKNPAEAAQLVMDRIPRGDAQSEALISVMHQWARQDFAAASAWVERIPEELLRERATQELEAVRRSPG